MRSNRLTDDDSTRHYFDAPSYTWSWIGASSDAEHDHVQDIPRTNHTPSAPRQRSGTLILAYYATEQNFLQGSKQTLPSQFDDQHRHSAPDSCLPHSRTFLARSVLSCAKSVAQLRTRTPEAESPARATAKYFDTCYGISAGDVEDLPRNGLCVLYLEC